MKSITEEFLREASMEFGADRANILAMNAVSSEGIDKACANVYKAGNNQHVFTIEVESGKVCNQKQSGRCWMFASYNVMRLNVMEKLNLENMELSQSYPLFYDKLEKANHFLENIIETRDEAADGRVVAFLLSDPIGDGGQWDMFRSLTFKYGCVPQEVYPETAVSSATAQLNKYLKTKLRGWACELRNAYGKGCSVDELHDMKDDMMKTVYRMLAICLGEPPKTFSWSVRDKDKNLVKVENITPVEFFRQYVGMDLDDYVTVINAPTIDKPYGRTYTVRYLGNVCGGRYPVKYLNLPMDDLRDITIRQLKDNKCVWFGSDVGQFSDRKGGYLTLDSLAVGELFDTDFPMDKAQRLDYGESLMTHAMVITGVELDENERPVRWKVENSWGKDNGFDGYYVMSDEWFGEYAYQILLDRKYFSPEQSAAFDTEPIELKPWDPMGSLATD